MIRYIKGIIDSIYKDYVIIDNNGIGYRVYFAHNEQLKPQQELKIYIYQHFREDGTILYGFSSETELDLFEKLISVKGLGPKTALTMLSKTTLERLIRAIESGEVAYLKSIPSLGTKTAQQIILDLKGKLIESDSTNIINPKVEDAIEGLRTLGYKQNEINLISKDLYKCQFDSSEQYLREGLSLLQKRKGK